MKKLVYGLLFAIIPVVTYAQNTQVKLGYLDVQTLFMAMPEAVQIDSTLKKLVAQHESEVKRMEDEYTRKLVEFKEGEATWDETIKNNRMEELQTLQTKMQNDITPGELGPIRRVLLPSNLRLTKSMSRVGMPSVMQTTSGISASIASIIESAASVGGTKIKEAVGCVSKTASLTVLNTGMRS